MFAEGRRSWFRETLEVTTRPNQYLYHLEGGCLHAMHLFRVVAVL
jgi:hypothetical protein